MSKINPYASPSEPAELNVEAAPPWEVDFPYVIVKPGVRLPRRCVVSNAPAGRADLVRKQFLWAPSFRLVLSHYRCPLEYFVAQPIRRRILIWSRLVPLSVLGIGVLLAVLSVSPIPVVLAGIAARVISHVAPRDRLKVKHFRGKRFWIEGCSPAFLEDCLVTYRGGVYEEAKCTSPE